MTAFRLAVLLALASIVAAGCGSGIQDATPPTNSGVATSESDRSDSNDGVLLNGDGDSNDSDSNDSDSNDSDSTTASEGDPDAPLVTVDGSPAAADESGERGNSSSVTQVLDEFVVSTTANPQDKEAIDRAGKELVKAWWYPSEATTYTELADWLEAESLITPELADEWRLQGNQPVVAAPDDTRIVKMWPVRVADDNATFQISAVPEGEVDETLTFIEFEIEDGSWKASGIE